jgi:ribosomal protein L11 methyltransferase
MSGAGSPSWWAVEVNCDPEIRKAVLWRLLGPGHRACAVQQSENQVTIWAFLDAESAAEQELSALWLGLHLDACKRQLPNPKVNWRHTDSWDWPEPIKKLLAPQEVGDRLTVVPAGRRYSDPDRITVHLDGRLGFGMGGLHATTRLCLEALERRVDEELTAGRAPKIADIGCGVGTLSVAAIKLGAKRVYAVDTKSASVFGTRQNRDLNGICAECLTVERGSVSEVGRKIVGPVDGFCCNILTSIILYLIPRFAQISGPTTWGILSGIKEEEREPVERQLEKSGWKTTLVSTRDSWCCMEIGRL